jgi:hypothetical protein
MRSAPAVSVVCRDGGIWRAATGLLHGWAIAAVLAWGLGWIGVRWTPLVVAAVVLAALAGASWSMRQPAALSSLAWDGQAWRLDEAAVARVAVMIDLGGWMLLAIEPEDGARRWCALSAAATGPAWRALRSAVFAQRLAAPRASP